MKKIKSLLLLIAFITITCSPLLAQDPPPPPQGGHGQSGNQPPGGGAPVGSGLVILLSLGAAYGGLKMYETRK